MNAAFIGIFSAAQHLGTARNHGIHPLDALRDAMAGDPWMPPQTS